jgi:hypothetical protein
VKLSSAKGDRRLERKIRRASSSNIPEHVEMFHVMINRPMAMRPPVLVGWSILWLRDEGKNCLD